MRWFLKYGSVLLLFNTILYSINETKDIIAPFIFYIIMLFGISSILINPAQIRYVILHRSFVFLFLLNLINLIYYLFLDDLYSQGSIEYLLARFVQFSLISFSVYHNQKYFQHKFFVHIVYVIVFISFISLIIHPNIFNQRYSGIIWNENMLASLTGIAFGIFLLMDKKDSYFNVFILLLLLVISLATGSRLVIIGLVIAYLLKYRFSIKTFFFLIIGFLCILFIQSQDLDTGINRVLSSELLGDRTDQFTFAIDNIKNNLFIGHGLDQYSGLPEDVKIPEKYQGLYMGAHSGYFSILLQYGLMFGLLVITIIIRKSVILLSYFRNRRDYINIYYFIILYTIFAGFFETLFTGINEFHTILFWISLSYLSIIKYKLENED